MTMKTLKPRMADVGGVPIARLLPNLGKQPIGAWCFLDHAGPADFDRQDPGLQVGRHPHTNLQTFSWMISGKILHKDSLGTEQVISKNQVNLMTAGTGPDQGISHTEQSVFSDHGGSSDDTRKLNLVQLWIALPTDQQIERSFHHYPDLPNWTEQHVELTLTTGSYTASTGQRYTAPTLQYSRLVGIDAHFVQDDVLTLNLEPGFEYGLLVVSGAFDYDGQQINQNELLRFDTADLSNHEMITVRAQKGTRLMFIGGEPLQQNVLLWWNFVADNKADIEQSISDWNAGHARFGDVDSGLKRLTAPPLPVGFKA